MNTARQSARQNTIDELRRLLAEATPGPWETDEFDPGTVTVLQSSPKTEALCVADLADGATDRPDANAALIVAAVNALPALLRVAEAAAVVCDPMVEGAGGDRWWEEHAALRDALNALEADHD